MGGGGTRQRPLSARLNRTLDAAHGCAERAGYTMDPGILAPPTSVYGEFERRAEASDRRAWSSLSKELHPAYLESRSQSVMSERSRESSMGSSLGNAERCTLEVVPQFDARFQKGDQRGLAGKPVWPRPARKMGPMWTLFMWYSKRDESGNVLSEDQKGKGSHVPSEKEMETLGADGLVNRNELLALLEDFNICPRLVARKDVMRCFKAADSGEAGGIVCNNRPDELCFPEFAETLARLALVAFSRRPWAKIYPLPQQKVMAILEEMDLNSKDTRKLRTRLAALERTGTERRAQLALRRWEHVAANDAIEAAANDAAVGFSTRDEAEARAWADRGMSLDPLPDGLADLMTKHEDMEPEGPDWVEFPSCALDMGCVRVGAKRGYRVTIRNRGSRKLSIRFESYNIPFAELTYSEFPMVPGIPRVLEIACDFTEPGEWMGAVEICVQETYQPADGPEPEEERHTVPIYARCLPDDGRRERLL